MKSEATSACCGSSCTISSMTRYVVRNLNLNRPSAIAASSPTSDDTATATIVMKRLFLRKFQYDIPITEPLKTVRKFASVGCSGIGCGVSEYISLAGLNAVEIIHSTGKSANSATSNPARFSAALRDARPKRRPPRPDTARLETALPDTALAGTGTDVMRVTLA